MFIFNFKYTMKQSKKIRITLDYKSKQEVIAPRSDNQPPIKAGTQWYV